MSAKEKLSNPNIVKINEASNDDEGESIGFNLDDVNAKKKAMIEYRNKKSIRDSFWLELKAPRKDNSKAPDKNKKYDEPMSGIQMRQLMIKEKETPAQEIENAVGE